MSPRLFILLVAVIGGVMVFLLFTALIEIAHIANILNFADVFGWWSIGPGIATFLALALFLIFLNNALKEKGMEDFDGA